MKFAENVLLEIVNIVAFGIENGKDVSEDLRQIDVELDTKVDEKTGGKYCNAVKLSERYLASKGRVF